MKTTTIVSLAMTVLVSTATLGCGAAAAPAAMSHGGEHGMAGGSTAPGAAWIAYDRPAPPASEHQRHSGARSSHASLRSGHR